MAEFSFEGNLDNVSEAQLNYIRSVLEKRGYKNEKVVFETVGQAGDNYIANVKRIIVEKDGETFRMIAKIASTIEMVRLTSNTAIMFQNEHYMYTKVLPKVTEMLKAAEVPKNERLRYPICYGTFMESPNEVILLEDLQLSDFEMLDRFHPLPSDTLKLILKNFAILHSISYGLKHQEPETYEKFGKNLANIWLVMQEFKEMLEIFGKMEEDILMILDNDKYKKLVKGSLSQMKDHLKDTALIDIKSRYSAIQHGDPWTNNIMFRLEGGKALECCMIDYQCAKIGSPAGDIHYMIFNCTDYETRSKHFHEWMDYYHSELDKNLANFGLKANYVYSRDQFDIDMRRHAKLSFCTALMLSSMMIRETADAAKVKDAMANQATIEEMMEETKLSGLNEASILRFKNRIEGVMDSFFELGFLVVM